MWTKTWVRLWAESEIIRPLRCTEKHQAAQAATATRDCPVITTSQNLQDPEAGNFPYQMILIYFTEKEKKTATKGIGN